jgi:hypothetical protein
MISVAIIRITDGYGIIHLVHHALSQRLQFCRIFIYSIRKFVSVCIMRNPELIFKLCFTPLHIRKERSPTMWAVMSERGDADCAFNAQWCIAQYFIHNFYWKILHGQCLTILYLDRRIQNAKIMTPVRFVTSVLRIAFNLCIHFVCFI